MNNVTKFLLVALVAAVTLSFVSGASARSRFTQTEYRSIAVTFTPSADGTFGGIVKPVVPVSGIIYAPVYHSHLAMMFDGGHDDGDTTDNDDTTDVGDDDTSGDHHHHGDTTDVGDDDTSGDHHHGDTTDVGDDDTTGDHHHGDTTDVGDDHHHDGNHNENDTIDCDHDGGHHDGHHGDDTTATNDTTDRALFGTGSQSIVIKTSSNSALIGLQFVNNQTANVTISKIGLAAGTNFTIISGAPAHATTLTPGQRINLTVRYTPNGASGQTDQLLITSNSTAPVNPITFKGIQNATSSVTNALPEGVSLTMAPNPMTSNLTVSLVGIAKSTVTIYDINGKTIRTADVNASSWTWDGTATDGTAMRAGTYFVNVAGTSTDGTPFASTRKIVVSK